MVTEEPLFSRSIATNGELKQRSSVFERRTATGSRRFAFLGIGFWKVVYLRVKTLSKTKFCSVKAYSKTKSLISG